MECPCDVCDHELMEECDQDDGTGFGRPVCQDCCHETCT